MKQDSPPAHCAFVNLWPDTAPGALGTDAEDTPAIQCFWPKQRRTPQASVVVCPGGGYRQRVAHECEPVGEWLNENGVAGFILRYRVGPRYHHPVELGDAQRGMRFVRAHAAAWGLDSNKIGILGFSAGGHLAGSASVHYSAGEPNAADPIARFSSRPDFQVLIYAMLSMGQHAHTGCCENLLGKSPSREVIDFLSCEKHVTPQSPPAFLAHSTQDSVVKIIHSDLYVEALQKCGVPYKYFREAWGDHGFCTVPGKVDALTKRWTVPCIEWLREIEVL